MRAPSFIREIDIQRLLATAVPSTLIILAADAAHHFNIAFPVPFLTTLACVTLAGALGGRAAGSLAGLFAAAFVVHASLEGFGPHSLTGGPLQVIAGILLYVGTGYLIGKVRDERDDSLQRLRRSEQDLKSSLDQETAAVRRQQAQIALSEARLQQAVKIAGLGYFEIDTKEDRYTFCSDAHAAQHGLTPEKFLEQGSTLHGEMNMTHPEDREAVRRNYAWVRSGTPVDMEFRILTGDGRTRYLQEVIEPVFDEAGDVVKEVGTSRDITELRQAELQLRQTQKMEAVGRLTAGIAHDFNNLLAIITGNLEFLTDRLDDRDARDMVAAALRAAGRGADLTRQLLVFGRQSDLHPEILDINQVVHEMAQMLRRTFPMDIDIETTLAHHIRPVALDAAGFESALLNLAINARDAMPNGGKLTFATEDIRIGAPRSGGDDAIDPGHYVALIVTDTGTGMSPEVLAQACEPFFSTKGPAEGSGLGLAMVYGFVRQSGGEIRIESEAECGTTVTLCFPEAAERSQAPQDELVDA